MGVTASVQEAHNVSDAKFDPLVKGREGSRESLGFSNQSGFERKATS